MADDPKPETAAAIDAPRLRNERFAALALPHLDAAYNLARWLTRNDNDARDVVQNAYLRAFRAFDGLQGDVVRPWLLAIVRNSCWTWLDAKRAQANELPYEEAEHAQPATQADPEAIAMRAQDRRRLDAALLALPPEFREVVVLRELQELSYAEIAQVLGIAPGTVMSRLSRGRARLARLLQAG